jgi:hypothetical protein
VDTVRRPSCGFCDGTGLWADQDGDPDPCPLCEGSGTVSPGGTRDDAAPATEVPLDRLLALLPRLSQPERQRLYEELHARYDCRIYRS